MFFLLSKTLGIMLLPMNFLIGLGLLGAVLLATRFAVARPQALIAVVVLLAVCGFSPLGNLLLYPLEPAFRRGTPREARLMASSCSADRSMPISRPRMARRSFKLRPTASLRRRRWRRKYPNARIVFTGGSAELDFERRQGGRLRRGDL